MEIKRVGSQASAKGPAEWFTGTVRIDPLFQAAEPARAAGASVTFEPDARTAWHTHPLGQTLIVPAGCGRVQRWGGPVEEVRPGDVVCSLRREALARGELDHRHDPHRRPKGSRRQGGRVDGARHRQGVRGLIPPEVSADRIMPHVIVKLWPGPSEEQEARLAEAITRNVASVLGLGEESVSVAIEEVESGEWAERVYTPDILGKPNTIYKKPGYDPSELP